MFCSRIDRVQYWRRGGVWGKGAMRDLTAAHYKDDLVPGSQGERRGRGRGRVDEGKEGATCRGREQLTRHFLAFVYFFVFIFPSRYPDLLQCLILCFSVWFLLLCVSVFGFLLLTLIALVSSGVRGVE